MSIIKTPALKGTGAISVVPPCLIYWLIQPIYPLILPITPDLRPELLHQLVHPGSSSVNFDFPLPRTGLSLCLCVPVGFRLIYFSLSSLFKDISNYIQKSADGQKNMQQFSILPIFCVVLIRFDPRWGAIFSHMAGDCFAPAGLAMTEFVTLAMTNI